MKPVLECLAEGYAGRYNDLSKICFLFPNKRSGTYFKNYLLKSASLSEKKLPHITTISSLVQEITGLKPADKIEELFLLYRAYLHISANGKEEEPQIDFDVFRRWGETVIADFNVVDLNLVNPEEIFKNVKDYREIASNFLTPEQKEVLSEYFGYNDYSDETKFWKNFNQSSSELKDRFLNLWQILAPLHREMTDLYAKKNLAGSGGIYRSAAEICEKKGRDAINYKKIVVFGFNAINGAERKIFEIFRDAEGYEGFDDFADFIWDATGPILNQENISASRFINSNKKYFPGPEWLDEYLIKSSAYFLPEIKIITSPSNTFQLKIAGEILNDYKKENPDLKDSDMALILPDETLLVNTLYSIPDEIEEVNLTMGYSFRNTGIMTFISELRRVFANMRSSQDDKVFFHKDIKLILTHPFSHIIFSDTDIDNVLDYISHYHKISISLSELNELLPDSNKLFDFPEKEDGIKLFFQFLTDILETLKSHLILTEESDGSKNFEIAHIEIFTQHLQKLERSLKEYQIPIKWHGIMGLLDRIISGEKINFEGEPLAGLQIMGTLETRGIDFKNIVVVSMNEDMMPRRSKSKSFIPEALRKSYGLPPAGYSEEIFSYYFYRLISRAEKVTLLYDARSSSGLRKGGPSRYLLQLKHFALQKINEENRIFKIQPVPTSDASVTKTDQIHKLIDNFSLVGNDKKNFSSSSLNTYRECEVKFFLKYLMNINPDPENTDFLDPITIGNILHEIMMELYLPSEKHKILLKQPFTVYREDLEKILLNKNLIWDKIIRKINKYFYRLSNDKLDSPLPDSSEMMAAQILTQIEEIIKHDIKLTPFNLLGCEISENLRIKLKSGRLINFRFAIDRLDEIKIDGETRLRIVDYKTGARKRTADSIEEVLHGDYRSEQVFQLFVYAWLLSKMDIPGKEKVVTEIYFVPDLISGKGGLPVIGKKEVKGFDEYSADFSDGIEKLIEEVFEKEKFMECPRQDSCKLCEFKNVCGK